MGVAGWLMRYPHRIMPYIAALGLSLYLARVLAEVTRTVWSLPALAVLAALAAVVGLGLARFITGRSKSFLIVHGESQGRTAPRIHHAPLWTTLPLWLYVLWPRQDPAIAWGVGLTSLITWLIQDVFRTTQMPWQAASGTTGAPESGTLAGIRFLKLEVFVFLIALVVYLFTLSPGLQPADGGEFQLVAARFGVAHPPGYPLYSILGGVFVRVPLGPNPAWRLNLFSAITAAATLALVSGIGRKMTRSVVGGILPALTLGSATTFWATATSASIRPLAAFFTALSLYALCAPQVRLRLSRFVVSVSRPTLFAIALGLGVAHHASLLFMGAVGLIYLLLVDPTLLRQPRRWRVPFAALALTQLVWLYLPLRDAVGAPLAPGDLTSIGGLMHHILARGFAGDMFAFATPEHLPDRLALLPTLLRFQFNPLLLIAALIGALLLLRRDWRWFVLLVGGFALHTFVTLTYRAPQTIEYEMPAFVTLALLTAQIARDEGRWSRLTGHVANVWGWVVAAAIVAGLFNLAAGWPSFRALSRQDDARQHAEALLQAVPHQAVVLSNWHWATPMWYLQQVERLRPDVEAKYVAPQGESLAQNWVDAIAEYADVRPTVAIRYFEPEYQGLPYRFEPLGSAFFVQSQPLEAPPQQLTPLNIDLEGQVRLLGYALESDEAATDEGPVLRPGQPLALNLAWTPLQRLEGDVALFAHLLRDGRLVGQGNDQRLAAGDYEPGEVIVNRFLVYPFVGEMPGDAQLSVGVYRPDVPGAPRLTASDGADQAHLKAVPMRPAELPPITSRPQWVPFEGGPTLAGVDWDTTVAGQLRLYLHWAGRSHPTALETTVKQAGTVLAQARVDLPGKGYVSSVYDLPWGAGPLVLTADTRAIGPWGVARDQLSLPLPRSGERYVPIGGEMILMSAAADRQTALSPGDQIRYDLRLVATRPLLRDRIISVSLIGLNADGSWIWRDLYDGVPALGAVPTFKWVRGSSVLDRHRLIVPEDAPSGLALGQLRVYDHYTQAVLPPLDPRLLSEGLSVPLDLWMLNNP